ncbi:unnamed protein product [Closterium sp. Naga37s-1]|nr:unnamed protein product [Closterium sp. Naga37s-1]
MLSPSYGARRFSSSASAESAPKHKPDLLRILAACALGSGAAAGVAVSIMDPKTFSALSFAATDYMTPFIRLLDLSALSFAATDYMTPFIRLLDPETSHQLAVLSGEWGLTPRDYRPDPPALATTVWGRRFSNPVGMAAGFDKDARCVDSMFALGLGFTEIGSVTPLPQPGNPKPRCFRLTEQKAVINRYGFNSAGIADVAERLGAWQARRQQRAAQEQKRAAADGQAAKKENVVEERVRDGVLAVNLGKNKTSEDAAGDYVQGVHALGQFADVLVVNVSSPNTPGLRKLQGRSQPQELLQRVQAARNEMEWGKEGPPPLLLKIAPDLTTEDMSDIAAVALSLKIDGLVVSNTTISRPDSILGLVKADEVGGLSGKPLFELSTAVLRQMYSLTKVHLPAVIVPQLNLAIMPSCHLAIGKVATTAIGKVATTAIGKVATTAIGKVATTAIGKVATTAIGKVATTAIGKVATTAIGKVATTAIGKVATTAIGKVATTAIGKVATTAIGKVATTAIGKVATTAIGKVATTAIGKVATTAIGKVATTAIGKVATTAIGKGQIPIIGCGGIYR